ncbi:MAG: hypothetical protein HUJ68_12545, partial [Clostridia bacterium]|nr:hypothetical protein [Clostridia bacterium]
AIEEVYNENVINEDKIIIQYLMLAILNLKNIEIGNFTTQYLVNFPVTLFEKEKKLEQVLRIINSQAIQDKVNLKIQFKDFTEYKDKIYDLMQEGYRFVMVLDDTFNVSIEEIRKLSMFKYIILSTSLDKYDRIKEYEAHIENLLIDEG